MAKPTRPPKKGKGLVIIIETGGLPKPPKSGRKPKAPKVG